MAPKYMMGCGLGGSNRHPASWTCLVVLLLSGGTCGRARNTSHLKWMSFYDPCWPGKSDSLVVPGRSPPAPDLAPHISLVPPGPDCSDDIFFEQRGWHNLLTGPETWGLGTLPVLAHLHSAYGYAGMPDLSRWATGLNDSDCPRFGLPANCTSGGARLDLPVQPQGDLAPEANRTVTLLMKVYEPYFRNGTFVGLFMGDELISSGGWSCQTMAATAALVKAIDPNVITYTNEGGHWPCGGPGDKVMSSIDIFSWDAYGTRYCGAAEAVTVRQQAQAFYPRMYPHQRIMLVPGLFATDPVNCLKFHNQSCPLDSQEAEIVLKLKAFWDWAQVDTRVVGMKPWHLASFAEGANPVSERTIGAYAMPQVLALLVHVGRAIISNFTM